MSTLKTNTLSNVAGTASTAIENAINGSAKAWVNFNGTGTPAIRASYNVSSITDVGTGVYTINFTTAFNNADYSWTVGGWNNGAGNGGWIATGNGTNSAYPAGVSTSSLGIVCFNTGGSSIDETAICVSIFK